jgi:hypothetical protein
MKSGIESDDRRTIAMPTRITCSCCAAPEGCKRLRHVALSDAEEDDESENDEADEVEQAQ